MLEGSLYGNNIPEGELQLKMDHIYPKALQLFQNNAQFLFVAGWAINIAFWYFNGTDENTGNDEVTFAQR